MPAAGGSDSRTDGGDPLTSGADPADADDPRAAGDDPAAFHFLSRWELAVARERIWDTLVDFHTWPLWWPGLEGVIETIHGDAEGVGQRATSSWRGPVGYSLEIAIESVERVYPEFLRGVASGDVVGEGVWRLSPVPEAGGSVGAPSAAGVPEAGGVAGSGLAGEAGWTEVAFDWNVRANRRWMEFLAPVARPLFVTSHDHVMKRGAEGLAAHLGCEIRGFNAHAK